MLFITFEAPLSGMSINPARTLASALHARRFDSLWVYLVAPPVGMLSGAALHTHALDRTVHCAKIDHRGDEPCIFRCEIHALHSQRDANTQPQAPASNR
jgi:aquaporin Z